jgi:hypothetical protein
MRLIGLLLAGGLVSTGAMVAHANPFVPDIGHRATIPATGIVKVWNGCGWGWHLAPGHWSQWRGMWVPPHCAPNRRYGGGAPYGSWGGAYGSWQPPYGGWRPYPDWQGPY